MAYNEGTHFGADEDLLSAYVLGRLEESERLKMDDHAGMCAQCREALRREMILGAGVRKLGREELKGELRRRIAVNERSARFPYAWSAAAALFLVAGLGVYYAIFNGAGNVSSTAEGTPPLAEKTERPAQPESGHAKLGENSLADNLATSREKQKVALPSAKGNTEIERRSEPAREISAAPAVAQAPASEEFWSDGRVESAPQSDDAPVGSVAESKKSLAVSGGNEAEADEARVKEQTIRLRGAALQLKKDASNRVQGDFLVRQQSASTLPASQDQLRRDRRTVPTRVDQRGGTTTLTMYLDTLVDEKDLKNARVEAARDDSVIVTLGRKRILYRFPTGQGAAGERQK